MSRSRLSTVRVSLLRRSLSWLTFIVGLTAGVAGFYATFPMWVRDLRMRGMAEPGCDFEQRAGGWMVTSPHGEERPETAATGCGRLAGKYVYTINGKPIANREDLFTRVHGSQGEVQRWEVGDIKGKQGGEVLVKLREHPAVHALSTDGATKMAPGGGLLFSLLELFGALALTVNISLAAALFLFLRRRVPVAPALTGALFAVGFGLYFNVGFTPAWYQWVEVAALIVGIMGFGTAVVALPDGAIRSPGAVVFVGLWVVLVAVCTMDFLPFYHLIPDGTAVAGSVLFAGGGLIALVRRQRRSASRREQLSLRWVILGLVVPSMMLFPALVPELSPTIREFQISVIFPLSMMVIPLAIVHGLHPLSRHDLVRWVRYSTLSGMLVSGFALALAVVHMLFFPIVQRLHLAEQLPYLALVLVVVAAGLAFYFRNILNNLVDILFFPMRLRALRAVPESESNLVDCWTVQEIEWCAKRALKGGFNATDAQVALVDEEGWKDLVSNGKLHWEVTPQELVLLRQGESVEVVMEGDDGFSTQLLPLRSRGDFLGLLIAHPSEEARYTDWDRRLMRQIADAVAEAVWRCTRVQTPAAANTFATKPIATKRAPPLSAH